MDEITRWRALVGSRVVVRHRLSTPDTATGAILTDLLGELVAVLDPGVLQVRTRTGTVEVPLDAVVAGKPVPPRASRPAPPHLAISIRDLVAVMARHWNPVDTAWLGGWWLRAAGGFTRRANGVVPLGPAGVDGDRAESFARQWFADRGLPAMASIASPVAGGVPDDAGPAQAAGAVLRARGWEVVPDGSALVLVAAVGGLRSGVGLPPGLALTSAHRPGPGWLAGYRYRGEELPADAVDLLLSAPDQTFWSVLDGDRTVAVARGSLADGWAGVTAVEVDLEYRRRGLARAMLAAIAGWAWAHGGYSCFVQTAESNLPAQRLYSSAGFVPHHRYEYLRAP